MPFEKGIKKKGGRKPGSLNKKTEIANKFVEYLVEKGYEDLDEIWNQLKPKDRMDALLKGLQFVIPQRARVEDERKLPTSITINMIPATQDNVKQIDNTIDITHEEVND